MNAKINTTHTLTLDAAHELLAQARSACAQRGFAATIAITDAGGHLRAFERADAAPFLTAEVAVDKAWTAASFGMSTDQWNQYMGEPTVAPLAQHPRLMPVGGGVPIVLLTASSLAGSASPAARRCRIMKQLWMRCGRLG
ncbi:uncharacterized protein GlcG (DUF336 family) [Rhodanobacter sp. K2T2]|uniref:GlcG/HbpS family heme-binding protein n=1 Tax=Rhodanobacter sp. K2T2 TaxID=2723085 RepID=UPI00179E21EB|nr:heme-binding protein [Rhodanobacter sp. K2T2]NYE30083.1 uncharacterized protein GlcG (DUF336 family) [Rhodanobacter sp. K2T2]